MNCAKCKVEIAAQSAIAGMWCARCGEKEEERLGKMVDELPSIAPADAPPPFISNELPLAVDMTYEEVKQDWEAESGKPAPAKKKGHR